MVIKLTVRQDVYSIDDGTVRMRGWISEAPEEYDHRPFVIQRVPVPEDSSDPADRFVNVASYAEMYAFPPDDVADGIPFYRSSSFDLLFEDEGLMRESLDMMEGFLRLLVKDMSNKDDIPSASVEVEIL